MKKSGLSCSFISVVRFHSRNCLCPNQVGILLFVPYQRNLNYQDFRLYELSLWQNLVNGEGSKYKFSFVTLGPVPSKVQF